MDDVVQKARDFHGHLCPGLTIGIRASQVALREIGPHSGDEEVVAIVEIDMCAVDAIQLMTGCTFGKGNLFHHDYGKNAYTFIRRSDGKAIRIISRSEGWPANKPEHTALGEKVRAGTATEEEHRRYWELHEERALFVMEMPESQLFEVKEVEAEVPKRARIHKSITCDECGESAMETRIRLFGGRNLCVPCFQQIEPR